jgi:MFS family permease
MPEDSTVSRVASTVSHGAQRIANVQRDYSKPPNGLKWRSNTLFIICTVGVGIFTDLFLYGLIVPVMPFMLQDRVGVPRYEVQDDVSMLLAVYAGASVVCSPIAGVLADRTSSRQMPFLLGLTALIFATLLFAVGQSLAVLTIARILQGISGAVVWTIGLALCLETVGPDRLGTVIGSVRHLQCTLGGLH